MKHIGMVVAGLILAVGLLTGCGGKRDEKVLNLFIWTEYLPASVIQKFTERTGIKINYDTYDSNEALLEKLQSGVADYDVVCPSDYMVSILISEGLLQKIDPAQVKNRSNLEAKFLNQKFDPNNEHTVPYFWGTTGIGYNKEKIPGGVTSWAVLFDEQYKGRILMLDDMRECFVAALKLLGYSLNETDPAKLAQAAELLKKQKSLVQTYNSGDFAGLLAGGDVDIAHGYNGQIAKVVSENPDKLAYVMPKEGGTLWMDSLCIPAKARNSAAAHQFINFILEPEISAEIVNAMHYASANGAAKAKIDPAILNDPAIYPPDATLTHCEFIEDIGDAVTVMDKYWTEIKAQ
jgi:spermidine/putrescine-binding protein